MFYGSSSRLAVQKGFEVVRVYLILIKLNNIKVTIDKNTMHYNPLAYIRSEKDILKLVNTKGEGNQSGEDFWVKAEACTIAP